MIAARKNTLHRFPFGIREIDDTFESKRDNYCEILVLGLKPKVKMIISNVEIEDTG